LATFTGTGYKVTGTFSTAAVSTPTPTPTPTPTTPPASAGDIPTATVTELTEDVNTLETTVESELASGTVTETTVTQTTTLGGTSATTTTTLVSQAATASTSNVLNVLSASSTASATGARVSGSTTNATAQQTIATQNTTILNNSASLLTTLAGRNETLTTEQTTAVRSTSTKLMTSAGSLATAATTASLRNLATQANSILASNAALGVAADAALVSAVIDVSVKIATNLIQQAITDAGGEQVTDAEITELLTSNAALLEEVLANTLTIPPDVIVTPAQRNARIQAASPNLPAAAANQARISTQKNIDPKNVSIGGINILSTMVNFLSGPTTATLLDDSGRVVNVMALEAGQTEITVDDATGTVTIKVPGETYSGTVVAVRSVPATVPQGLRFRRDGRITIVTNGVAVDIAPYAVSVLNFIQTINEAGYAFTQNDNASFSLDIGGNQRFNGVFAYDNLVGETLSNCGAVGITEPTGALNSAGYAFGIECANGVSQRILPFADNANFYSTIAGASLTARTDRNTGFITITGVGAFKPSFFISQPTAAELDFHATAKDSFGIALQATDANNDGIVDYKVISANGVQVMYGVN